MLLVCMRFHTINFITTINYKLFLQPKFQELWYEIVVNEDLMIIDATGLTSSV